MSTLTPELEHKLVFAQFLAAEFRDALIHSVEHAVPLHEAEMAAIGVDHGLVGAMLAKRWAFPEHLVDCIRDHHNPLAEPSAMMDCLRVADQVVRFREIGDRGIPGAKRKRQRPRSASAMTWRR